FCYFMDRLLPMSTLFPYTTLFRSFCDMVGFTEIASRVDPEILRDIIRSYEDTCAASITRYDGYVFQRQGDGIVAFFGYPLAHEGDRKSTRLNSSHVKISYAVFCLK